MTLANYHRRRQRELTAWRADLPGHLLLIVAVFVVTWFLGRALTGPLPYWATCGAACQGGQKVGFGVLFARPRTLGRVRGGCGEGGLADGVPVVRCRVSLGEGDASTRTWIGGDPPLSCTRIGYQQVGIGRGCPHTDQARHGPEGRCARR